MSLLRNPNVKSVLTVYNEKKENRKCPLWHREVNIGIKPDIPA